MESSRRNEESLQSGGPLSSSHQESQSGGTGRHGGGKAGRKDGAQDHTIPAPVYDPSCYQAYRAANPSDHWTVPGEQGSPTTPLAVPQGEGRISENQSDLKSQSRAHKRKKSECAQHIPTWLKICFCIIIAVMGVFTYTHDIATFMAYGILLAALLIFYIIKASPQIFRSHIWVSLNNAIDKRQRGDHSVETSTRAKKNGDDHQIGYQPGSQIPFITGPSHKEIIPAEPTDSTLDGAVFNHQLHHKAAGGENVDSPGSMIPPYREISGAAPDRYDSAGEYGRTIRDGVSPTLPHSHYCIDPGRHRAAVPDEKGSARVEPYLDSTHPEFAAGFIRSSGLTAWGASRRGRSHVKNNTPRQDSFSIRAMHGGLVAIVADGVGSTKLAEKASAKAAAACIEFDWHTPRSEDEWYKEVMEAIEFAHYAIIGDLSCDENQFPSTTLTTAVVTQSSKGYILDWFSVGDSAIMTIPFDPSGQISIINRAPLMDGPTAALPYSPHGPQVEYGYHSRIDFRTDILVLATDGCFKPMYQCPGPYIKNFSGIVQDVADSSHLLAAIRQDGAGYTDDSTAILIASTGE